MHAHKLIEVLDSRLRGNDDLFGFSYLTMLGTNTIDIESAR